MSDVSESLRASASHNVARGSVSPGGPGEHGAYHQSCHAEARRHCTRRRGALDIDEITGDILDVSLRIHREIGPGLLESLYVSILACELRRRRLHVAREQMIRFSYDGNVVE